MSAILVIDDDRDLRRGVRAALTAGRFEVAEAETAEAGLRTASQVVPDLVLCDYNLGQGNGLDVLAQLRENPATASIPLILITASDDASVRRRSMDLGADDFLHKPFTGEELLAAVRARLKKQETIKVQLERALRDIEARHRLLFESSSDAVMVVAPPAWRFVEGNAATLRIFGARTKAELLATGPWEVSPERQPDGSSSAVQAKKMIEAALRDGSHYFEWTHQRLNGETFPATVLLARLELAGQTLLQATVRDITERKRTELLLTARAELAEVSRDGNLDELLQQALDRAEQLTGSCIGFFHFVDPDQQNLTLQTWSTNTLQKMCKADGKGRHYPLREAGVWVDCIRARAPVIHNDYASLPHRKGLPEGHAPVVREAVVPIERDGLVVCIMGVGNKPTDYTPDDVRFLVDLASVVADYAIRLRAEQALQASERRYQTLAESSPAGVFRTDQDGLTTYVNSRWCELAGLSREQALGEGWLRAVHPEDREALLRDWTEARTNVGVALSDYRFQRPDGSLAWVLGQAIPEKDAAGRLIGYVGTVTDITARKRAEEALRASEAMLNEMGRVAKVGGWSLNVETQTLVWTQEVYAIHEVEADFQPTLERAIDFYQSDSKPLIRRAVERAIHLGEPFDLELELITAQGRHIWTQAIGRPTRRDGVVTHVSGTFQDITKRRRTEQALQESEARFRAIATAASDAILMMNPDGKVSFWNAAAERVFGFAESEALGADVFELIAPPELHAAYEEAFPKIESPITDAVPRRIMSVQAKRKDGTHFAAEWSISGAEIKGRWHAVGIVRDVTRQQEMTHMLMQERILLRTLIDALPDCVYAKDREARKTLANLADVYSLGAVNEQDVLGKTDYDLLDRKIAASCYADDMRVITHGEPVINRQELIINPHGHQHWLETTKLPLRDDLGQIIGLVGIGHNITARRRAEEQLRKLSMAVEQSPASVVITDTAGRIEYVNPQFCAVTGYSAEEVLGQNPRLLKSGETPAEEYESLWRRITNGQEWRGEFHNCRKNGELYWETAVISPIKNQRGVITHFLAVKEDITERREAERRLRDAHAVRSLILENSTLGIALVRDRNFVWVNGRLAELLGLPIEKIQGASTRVIYPSDELYETLGRQAYPVLAGGGRADTVLQLRRGDGNLFWCRFIGKALNPATPHSGSIWMFEDITEQKLSTERLAELHHRNELILNSVQEGILQMNRDGCHTFANQAAVQMLGWSPAELAGKVSHPLWHHTRADGHAYPKQECPVYTTLRDGRVRHVTDEVFWRKDGTSFPVEYTSTPIWEGEDLTGVAVTFRDISEQKRAEAERQRVDIQLRHAQKLESIGQLAAGIAHEINTPMQYIGDNTRFLQDAFNELRRVVDAFQELTGRLRPQPGLGELLAPVETILQTADLDYLLEETPKAIEQSLQGAERITKIVRAMKEFSHPGTEQKTAADLNHAIESTVTVARNEWKYVADLETDFDLQLPQVPCLPGEFNQVILNLIINAAHAIADVVGKNSGTKGRIIISTRRQGDWAEIRVDDTGTGIPESARGRIFDPFFTTKPVGKGSGQGLAIAHSVIVDKHGGTLAFETELGRGTTFIIRLPLTASEKSRTPPAS